jgi:hypothetical protein
LSPGIPRFGGVFAPAADFLRSRRISRKKNLQKAIDKTGVILYDNTCSASDD